MIKFSFFYHVGHLSRFNRSSYDITFAVVPSANLEARLWTFSRVAMSFFRCGDHTGELYSRIGLKGWQMVLQKLWISQNFSRISWVSQSRFFSGYVRLAVSFLWLLLLGSCSHNAIMCASKWSVQFSDCVRNYSVFLADNRLEIRKRLIVG